MPDSTHHAQAMTGAATEEVSARLKKRLDRERRARLEAEAIAERGLRELYEKQRAMALLQAIAVAANEAADARAAMQTALERICEYTGWPVGHLCLRAEGAGGLVSTDIWHLSEAGRFAALREALRGARVAEGAGLSGQAEAEGRPVWAGESAWPAGAARDYGLTAGFALPVMVGSEVGAVLEFFSDEMEEPGEGLLALMSQVGTQLGRAVEREQAAARLLDAALHDGLTGLANRASFLERLRRSMGRAEHRRDYQFAVLYLDFDRFKSVNDSLGHAAGDELLIEIAARLKASLRPSDLVARLGGDEFAILVDHLAAPAEATLVADRLNLRLAEPFHVGGREILTTVSIGVALSATADGHPEHLLRDADAAMCVAKARGKARWEVFDAGLHARAAARLQIETDLRQAIGRGELRLHYQPIVSLAAGAAGRMTGCEALVRWQHPERGLIPPGEFIPLAEETGLINQVGLWVLEEACRRARAWQEGQAAPPDFVVSVNLSGKQLQQRDLVEQVARALSEAGLAPQCLKLEITESMVMESAEAAAATLGRLKALGVSLAIDDFGTGYSSLSYLHRFPIDTLKIDRSFVSRMCAAGENAEIVRTVVSLAHALRMDVVAEGVESGEQVERLRALGCEYAQGYYFSKPVDAEAFGQLLSRPRPPWEGLAQGR